MKKLLVALLAGVGVAGLAGCASPSYYDTGYYSSGYYYGPTYYGPSASLSYVPSYRYRDRYYYPSY